MQKENYQLKDGNGNEITYNEIPCVRLSNYTEEQKKAYILAHNKLTMNTDFDIDILNDELDDILNIDMSDFGFDLDLEDEFNEEDLEDERKKEKVNVSIVLNSYQDYEIIKERIENLTDEVNGNLSIKMI